MPLKSDGSVSARLSVCRSDSSLAVNAAGSIVEHLDTAGVERGDASGAVRHV